ncbi:putative F-box protein At3g52320 [Papaver somniferum]|uniref:putative F-box protein At3g52320 n=1 Tax=Papaver somniferum TaxID=3469 RepID=UPI000E6F9F76|nr:putative F-box protein At3g52320 [Papaver somniferum]
MSSSCIPVLDVGHQTKKRKQETFKEIDAELCKKLPEDLAIENIATRLPARTLARYSCVSKLWYNSIFNDARFAAHHFALQSHKKLVFNLLNVSSGSHFQKAYLFNLQRNDSDKNIDDYDGDDDHVSSNYIVNPARGETLALMYCDPTISTGGEHLCHGFGFESSSQEYKVVIIFTTRTTNQEKEDEQLFVCMVITSGTNSWRKIVTKTSEMSLPFSSPHRRIMVTRAWRNYRRSATLCGGDLFWRIANYKQGGEGILL